jgi:hypothetical protein
MTIWLVIIQNLIPEFITAVGLVPLATSLIMSFDRHPDKFIVQFVINTFIGTNLLVIFSSLSDLVAVVTGEAIFLNFCQDCCRCFFPSQSLPGDEIIYVQSQG